MKRYFLSVATIVAMAGPTVAHAEWTEGFYVGGGVQIIRGDFPAQVERRVGGNPNVPLEDGGDPSAFYVSEPGNITTPMFRGGWRPIPWVAVEALLGFGVDKDVFNENPRGQLGLDSIKGIYLKPQLAWGNFNFYGRVGITDFEFSKEVNYGPNDAQDDRLGNGAKISDSGTALGGGIELRIARTGSVAFEYVQHFDDEDNSVIGAGVMFNYWFGGADGGDGDDDDYY